MVKLSELLRLTDAPIVVSGCLAGHRCRYDGQSKPVEAVQRLVETGRAFTVCPEVLGGLPTPRPASGIRLCQNVSDIADVNSGITSGITSGSASDRASDRASSSTSDLTSDIMSGSASDIASDIDVGEAVWRGRAELINREGRLVTSNYKRGAQQALALARAQGSTVAILKQHSPSCGVGSTGGADPWRRLPGDGVTAALFKSEGLTVVSDEDVEWDV